MRRARAGGPRGDPAAAGAEGGAALKRFRRAGKGGPGSAEPLRLPARPRRSEAPGASRGNFPGKRRRGTLRSRGRSAPGGAGSAGPAEPPPGPRRRGRASRPRRDRAPGSARGNGAESLRDVVLRWEHLPGFRNPLNALLVHQQIDQRWLRGALRNISYKSFGSWESIWGF